jgi:DNA-binding protein YbaB
VTDEEYVAAIEEGVRATRARAAEFNAAIQRAIELDPISDLVVATLDGDGYLRDLFIEPTALTSHTYIELEDLITEVLRDSNVRLREVVMEAVNRYWGADSSWNDLKALADELS